MATLIISFGSEQEAQEAVERLSQAGLGDVRARVLNSSESLSHEKTDATSPMIVPDMGSIEVRPTATPKTPEAINDGDEDEQPATIPTHAQETDGVQVMIEMGDTSEEAVRRILGLGAAS